MHYNSTLVFSHTNPQEKETLYIFSSGHIREKKTPLCCFHSPVNHPASGFLRRVRVYNQAVKHRDGFLESRFRRLERLVLHQIPPTTLSGVISRAGCCRRRSALKSSSSPLVAAAEAERSLAGLEPLCCCIQRLLPLKWLGGEHSQKSLL